MFTPFKKSKLRIVILLIFASLLSIWLCIDMSQNNCYFSLTQLRDLSQFVLNLTLVIATLGIAIFTLPIDSEQTKKSDLLLSYIGHTLLLASITIFSYILSYSSLINGLIINLYMCGCLILMASIILKLLATIVAYFNIRD